MALPNGAGGYQIGDGNLTEAVMGVQTIPTTLTGDTTLTAAQVAVGLVVCQKASDATLTVTLPTAALPDAAITSAKVGSSFDLTICNNNNTGASSTVPVTAGTGITLESLNNTTGYVYLASNLDGGAGDVTLTGANIGTTMNAISKKSKKKAKKKTNRFTATKNPIQPPGRSENNASTQ